MNAPVTQALRDKPVYSFDDMFAAVCIWEEMVDSNLPDAPAPWADMRDAAGSCQMRDWIITKLARAADEAWTKASRAYDNACRDWAAKRDFEQAFQSDGVGADEAWHSANPEPQDPGALDYEFVPTWLRIAVDWTDYENGPRVLGSTKPSDNLT